jgi:ribosomal protein S18 acetylase RimI-like enzyme
MTIRPYRDSDLPALIDLTIETFRPFYEDYVQSLLGEEIYQHQHGNWEQDYHDEVPTLHDPAAGRFIAVAETDGAAVGLVAWNVGGKPHHGQISLLAVSRSHRGQRVGHDLCQYAIGRMRSEGVEVVGIGTGDDSFHAAARSLYEELGFTKIPVAAYLKRI